jgi:hypothetical protein
MCSNCNKTAKHLQKPEQDRFLEASSLAPNHMHHHCTVGSIRHQGSLPLSSHCSEVHPHLSGAVVFESSAMTVPAPHLHDLDKCHCPE